MAQVCPDLSFVLSSPFRDKEIKLEILLTPGVMDYHYDNIESITFDQPKSLFTFVTFVQVIGNIYLKMCNLLLGPVFAFVTIL